MLKKFKICPHGELYMKCALCMDDTTEEPRIIKLLRVNELEKRKRQKEFRKAISETYSKGYKVLD